MVHISEPEARRNLSDDEEKRSLEDLMNCQEGSEESSDHHMGIEMGSLDDLRDCQVSSEELSSCQVGNEMGSLGDLIDCQEGREEIPYCQVGKGEKRGLLNSFMNSEVSSGQREELIEKDQTHFLIIGGIEIFLPLSLVEARACAIEAEIVEGWPSVTSKTWRRCQKFPKEKKRTTQLTCSILGRRS
jgi:hypothetical protein